MKKMTKTSHILNKVFILLKEEPQKDSDETF